MLYELINPSDAVTFYADSVAVARIVAILVGQGQYPIKDAQGEACGGLLLFMSQAEVDSLLAEWFEGTSVADFIEQHKAEIITALESFATMSRGDRRIYDAACAAITDSEKLAEFKASQEDVQRTSLNRITDYAVAFAKRLRGQEVESVPAPNSVLVGEA